MNHHGWQPTHGPCPQHKSSNIWNVKEKWRLARPAVWLGGTSTHQYNISVLVYNIPLLHSHTHSENVKLSLSKYIL